MPKTMNQAVSDMPRGASSTPFTTGECSGTIHPHTLLCSIP